MKDLIILLLLGVCYFKTDINLNFKNDTVYSKKQYKLLFAKTN